MIQRDWSKFPIGKPLIRKGSDGFWYVKRNGAPRILEQKADLWAADRNFEIWEQRREQRTHS